jgi:hypothetical protein
MDQGSEMEESNPTSLKAGLLLAGRYRLDEAGSDGTSPVFNGVDEQTDTPIVAFEIESSFASVLAAAARVSHAHLARLREVVSLAEEGGRSAVVAERVDGQALRALLGEIGKKSHVDAVRSALRIADALCSLHAAGGAHGAVSDRTLIVQPEAHAAPTLVFGPRNPPGSHYRRPSDQELPSEADDSWATAALLYHMLTGHPPPPEGLDSTDELDLTELEDPELCEALFHGLARDEDRRSLELRPLKRELARWFVDHAREEVLPVSTRSSQPPPLPPGALSTPAPPSALGLAAVHAPVPALTSSMPRAPARKSQRRLSLLAGGGILLGLAAAWGLSAVRNRPRIEFVEVGAKENPAPQPAASTAIDLSEVPVTGEREVTTGDKLTTCVAGYLPKGAFAKPPGMSGFCEETDPRAGGAQLRAAVVSGARPGAGPTDAMKLVSRLGWYEMATFAVIRSACCADAKPLALPAPSKDCPALDGPLRELGKAVMNNQGYEAPLKEYATGVACEVRAGRAALYNRTALPHPGEEAAFMELVKTLQTP